MPDLPPLAGRVIEAYGGEGRWRTASAIECRLSAYGWAFRLKMRPSMKDVRMRAPVWEPRIEMEPWGRPDRRAVLQGGSVYVESAGNVVSMRENAGRYFPGGRRTFRWDELDQVYFAGYAAWNYLVFPALLLREDIGWRQVGDSTLEATFPAALPTHSAVQRFHFDPGTGLLRQHDYTAEVFGGWAKAANVVLAHGEADGVPYPSTRRVTPRRPDGRPRGFPLLVGIEISDWRLT